MAGSGLRCMMRRTRKPPMREIQYNRLPPPLLRWAREDREDWRLYAADGWLFYDPLDCAFVFQAEGDRRSS